MPSHRRCRKLLLVLGDQLDRDSAVFEDADPRLDTVWMAEVEEEQTHVWCHKLRIAFFLSAMRQFRGALEKRDWTVRYHELSSERGDDRGRGFAQVLSTDLATLRPEVVRVVQPGDWRVLAALRKTADEAGIELQVLPDHHFYCDIGGFIAWADSQKALVMENFYRQMRRRHGVLVDGRGKPVGGEWNFDLENRKTFGKAGPRDVPALPRFTIHDDTRRVMELVESRFSGHPGTLDHFNLPVTRRQALAMLRDFIEHRLPQFGDYEDAMWSGEPVLWHSRLSAALNVKLISPRECVDAAVEAFEQGHAPINCVEGFVRQLLGWREFIRGVYWRCMPDYIAMNGLGCGEDTDVPRCFWDGETQINCVREAMQSVVQHGYAHHIQRLMVLGLLAQLLGVHPRRFHDWHMGMYIDAIDWVSLPNTLGMSQHGDGGIVGTKPYCASGNYINRMSNYCQDCRYRPGEAAGEDACPFTSLYWDFLARHEKQFASNPRMAFQYKNLGRKKPAALKAIRSRATKWKKTLLE